MGSESPSVRVERAIVGAREARLDGHPDDALRRLTGAAALLGSGRVKRELAVALCRERGLCHVALDEPDEAWQAFDDGLELAGRDDALADPLLAAEATLELMAGHAERAQARLATGDGTRRASLVAQARVHLLLGRTALADTTLQACEQASGGSSDLAPPSAVLRSLAALWDGRPEQARMLHNGVGTANHPHWDLVRILVLRSQWVATGDARYLVLALGAAEELRALTAHATTPGLLAAACGHHAVLLCLSGHLAMALEAADEALGVMGTMSLPEWPHAAVLHDLALVFRDAGATERHQQVLEMAAGEDMESWIQR
ncbi:MAG: hypothetical protein QF464_18270, partial [Myxococcota bacterium]|nr:hypothetical protein [Myxococcota bacterium]